MKYILPLLFSLIFLGILVLSVVYLSRRMQFYFETETIRFWAISFALIPVLMIVGLAGFSNATSFIGSAFYKVSAVLTGFTLYFLMTVLFLDLLHLFIKINPKVFGISAFLITFVIVGLGILNAFRVQVTQLSVPLHGLHKQVRAVHLSDIHIGHFRGEKFFKQLMELTAEQKPDVIFITGDLFDGRINLSEEVLMPLKSVSVPIYFVEGNHDGYTGVQTIKEMLRDFGVRVLENEVEMLGDIQLVGLNHMRADKESRGMHTNGGATIKGTLDTLAIGNGFPTILLHHSPDGAKYADEHGVDLYLSGHTHAGQLFPVTLMNELIFPYNRGMNEYNDLKMFVSEGVGTFGPPMRIATKSEIVVFNLVPSAQ